MAGEMSLTEISATSKALISSVVQETLKQEMVLLPTIMDMSSQVLPGAKSVDFPRRGEFAAESKAENTAYTKQVITFAADSLLLNKHEGVFVSIEKIGSLQSAVDVRAEVIKEMGKELSLQLDKDLLVQIKLASAAAPDHRVQFANTPTDTIQQTDLLEARRLLNVAKVPMADRTLLVPPDQEKALLSIADFVRADTYAASVPALQNGELGRLYGMTVIMHTELVAAEFLVYHKSHVAFARQLDLVFDTDKDLENSAELMLMEQIYGTKVLDSGKRAVWFNATGA